MESSDWVMSRERESYIRSSFFVREARGRKNDRHPLNIPVVLVPGIAIRFSLFILGLNPYTYCSALKCYTFRWWSLGAVYTVFTLAWLTGLIVTSFIGLANLLFASTHQNAKVSDLQVMGVVIVFGCLFNAWLNVLTTLSRAHRYCELYNGWLELASSTSLRPHKGIRVASHIYAVFLLVFVICVLAMGVAGPPDLLLAIVDLLTKVLFLVDEDWLAQGDSTGVKVCMCIYLTVFYSVVFELSSCSYVF